MRKLALCLIALLVVATLAEDVEAGRRHRLRRARRWYSYDCQPCVPCTPCIPSDSQSLPLPSAAEPQPASTSAQVCPYYPMMGIWYAERFATPTDCTNGYPVSHPNGPSQQCVAPHCGCEPVSFSPSESTESVAYQGNCYATHCHPHGSPEPPSHDDQVAKVLNGPHWLKIRNIDNTPVAREVFVVFYHLQLKNPPPGQQPVPFWVGFECTKPPRFRTVDAITRSEDCEGLIRVTPGAGATPGQGRPKDILIQITQAGCP